MKKYILTWAVLALVGGTASAQGLLGRLGERAKQAVENNIGNKIEEGVNNVLNGKKKAIRTPRTRKQKRWNRQRRRPESEKPRERR